MHRSHPLPPPPDMDKPFAPAVLTLIEHACHGALMDALHRFEGAQVDLELTMVATRVAQNSTLRDIKRPPLPPSTEAEAYARVQSTYRGLLIAVTAFEAAKARREAFARKTRQQAEETRALRQIASRERQRSRSC